MGNQTEDTKRLIDFLYKDTELIASLYAQIFAGNINFINKSQSELDERNTDLGGGIAGVASLKAQSKTSNTSILQQSIDPHDYRISQILEELQLDILNNVSDSRPNQLVIVEGNILIRDLGTIRNLLETKEILDIIPGIKQTDKKAFNMIRGMMKFLPTGIEFEVHTVNHENILGGFKEEFLTTPLNDVLRLYGGSYPNKWHVLGIIDRINTNEYIQSKSDFKQGIDTMSQGIFGVFNGNEDKERYVIKPIAVYRYLTI